MEAVGSWLNLNKPVQKLAFGSLSCLPALQNSMAVLKAHRTHLDEFYAVFSPEGDLQSLNKSLNSWEWVYNNIRSHRALDNLTPKQYIEQNPPGLIPVASHMY